MIGFPKFTYIRSKKLMEAYRKIPCQHCGIEDGTVCGAHSNSAQHGKGRGIKASDSFAASLCHRCHMQLDQGKDLSLSERLDMWLSAHRKTIRELVSRGLWPAGIAVPNSQ